MHQHRKVWGRKVARPLKINQKRLLDEELPKLQLFADFGKKLDLTQLMPGFESYILEIGFGGGEHLAWRAQQSSSQGFIGCEPFITGVAGLLGYIEDYELDNVRIVIDDARVLLQSLPDASLDRIFILFPDPWHKKRHHKRRIVSDETIGELSRVLKKGGELMMATDIQDYADWMVDVLSRRSEFTAMLDGRQSVYERPHPWLVTRYEQKGIDAGRKPSYLLYRKND
ncbi:tRNA (guanosine(46)-N7)-methyltransferase TrmB [Candidatus Odyssella thessalonicensis]|uniref:tRNA (guanosine(46)-N7)-methyltransferase TrmB n=1 Tax=Candidatus Odyssella thessalonicensis TaxID=84647 RepID=UPI000225B709|nr:tRNA (guanosine(46)-N7)-methyltransferase TrmB [Candidatus Odyssella thessalonicensis]